MNFDQNILLFIQENLRNEVLTPFIIAITKAGNKGLIWIFLLVILLIRKDTRQWGKIALLSFIVCVCCGELIKYAVMRPRPFITIAELTPLVKPPHSFSFPSVHTVSSFAVACIPLWAGKKRWALPLLILAFLMAFSRLYVGVHYPSDVLGGFILATCGSYLSWRLYHKFLWSE